jgi:hypothetical protein
VRSAQIIVFRRGFSGWVDLLRLAARLDCELVSSRRGNILLVPHERRAA